MSKQDFSKTFLFDKSPGEVFDAVNNVRGWWSTLLEGSSGKEGDVFIYRHKDIHASTQKLVEVVKNKKVTWLVTDSHLSFLEKKPDEWTGTTISFEIEPAGNKTKLYFTHHGLTPQKECFEDCSGGWNFYLQSLAELISTGEGQPDK
ncbi:MAG: ATPase [Citrobacter freundii]|nr:MAG: ATPase [Citrobacter freundii]